MLTKSVVAHEPQHPELSSKRIYNLFCHFHILLKYVKNRILAMYNNFKLIMRIILLQHNYLQINYLAESII